MSSAQNSPDASRKGHIRRALHRIATPFRRLDGSSHGFEADGGCVSPSFPAGVDHTRESSMSDPGIGPSRLYDGLNSSTADSRNALLAVDDSPSDHLSYPSSLDPSQPVPGSFVSGEWTLNRASIHTDRAQRLMSRYGVNMQPNDISPKGSSPVVHRVQRAPRMRLHRACHQCGVEFSHHKKCRACGHDICKRCPRSEGRRARAGMGDNRQTTQATDEHQVIEAGPSEMGRCSELSTSTLSRESRHMDDSPPRLDRGLMVNREMRPLLGPAPNVAWPENLEVDEEDQFNYQMLKGKGKEPMILAAESQTNQDLVSEESATAGSGQGKGQDAFKQARRSWSGEVSFPSIYSRKDVAVSHTDNSVSITQSLDHINDAGSSIHKSGLGDELVVDTPKSIEGIFPAQQEIEGRALDQHHNNPVQGSAPLQDYALNTTTYSAVRNVRSGMSLQYLPISAMAGSQGYRSSMKPYDSQPTMFSAVQRVYRKPRQRIRYMCHECNIPLLQAQTCSKCDHQRCERCRRCPTLKERRDPDPAYVQEFETRLSAMHQGLMSAGAYTQARQNAAVGV